MRSVYFIVTPPINIKCGSALLPNILRYKSSPFRTVSLRKSCCVLWNFEKLFNHYSLFIILEWTQRSTLNKWIVLTPLSRLVIQPSLIEIMLFWFNMTMLRRHTLLLSSKQKLSSSPELNFFSPNYSWLWFCIAIRLPSVPLYGSFTSPPQDLWVFGSRLGKRVPRAFASKTAEWYRCRIEQLTQRWMKIIKNDGIYLEILFFSILIYKKLFWQKWPGTYRIR